MAQKKKEEKNRHYLNRNTRIFILIALSVYFSLFFLYKQYYTNFDYGKLVKYGQVICDQGKVFKTNYFSYNYPDYPFINHHWGTGVIFYLLHQLGGLNALTLLAVLCNLIAFILIITMATKRGNFMAVILMTLLALPLLTSRSQPRPEIFSIVFFVVNISVLYSYYRGSLKKKYLWILPVVQLLWVNIHILFFFGIFLQGTLLLQLFISRRDRKELLWFLMIFAASIAACFINPAGLQGVLYPFNIMGDIQYSVGENAPLFSSRALRGDALYYYQNEFLFVLGFVMLYFWARNLKKAKEFVFIIIWLVTFGVLFLWRVRAGVFFAYVMVLMVGLLTEMAGSGKQKIVTRLTSVLTILLFLVLFMGRVNYYWPYHKGQEKPGLGIVKELDDGAAFFINNKLHGPIFNNFDIGDYLIYYLFPQERVFVDSRPEAYPPGFFKDQLLPAFDDYRKFLMLDYQYNFNVVFLANHRQVKKLTQELFYDSRWFVAYNDKYCVIFLKRNPENDKLLRQELMSKNNLREIIKNFERTAARP